MDKRTAIVETLALWKELARTGGGSKGDAAEAIGMLHVVKYLCRCPCCEYTQPVNCSCIKCPLWGQLGYSCNNIDRGEYVAWLASYDKTARRAAAAKIVKLAESALAKLDEEED